MADLREIRNLILTNLARKGCSVKEIKFLIKKHIDVDLGTRQIQRVLNEQGLSSRSYNESPLHNIEIAILNELQGPGSLLGYRAMWNRLKHHYNLKVKRSTVMVMLAMLNPEGTVQRKSGRLKRRIYRNKGPNFIWHCDGYDKLKPYGLPIHACIDGYSRKILWLEVASNTSDPAHIAHYYLTVVKKIGGCPRFLRTDLGTENSTIAFLQPLFQHLSGNGATVSHIYGKSMMNQRIESFWSQLRKSYTEWWINFFKELVVKGILNVTYQFHVDTARYAFGPLIQEQLNSFKEEWNAHVIRRSAMAEAPGGIPNVLYEYPELIDGVSDHFYPIDEEAISNSVIQFSRKPSIVGEHYKHLADTLVVHHNLPLPSNLTNSVQLFLSLLQLLDQYF